MSDILITRPNHDVTTNYLYYFAQEVIAELSKRPINIIDLSGKRASRINFQGRAKKIKPSIIFLNGHGNPSCVCGHENEKIVEVGSSSEILYHKIIYALSCDSAKELGKETAEKGGATYIGYNDKFVFFYQNEKITKPQDDQTARYFLEPSNRLIISLGKGNSAKEAFDKSQKEFDRNISLLISSKSPQTDTSFLPYLIWDRDCQVCLGDTTARIK